MIIAGLFSRPRDLEVPTKNIPIDISKMPIRITARFGNLSVKRYMRGLRAAYMTPGTAKQTPMKAGENPYLLIWIAKPGAMN